MCSSYAGSSGMPYAAKSFPGNLSIKTEASNFYIIEDTMQDTMKILYYTTKILWRYNAIYIFHMYIHSMNLSTLVVKNFDNFIKHCINKVLRILQAYKIIPFYEVTLSVFIKSSKLLNFSSIAFKCRCCECSIHENRHHFYWVSIVHFFNQFILLNHRIPC